MKYFFTVVIGIFVSLQSPSQISTEKLKKIDSLFIEWNQPDFPGGAIGISVKGKPVFTKAYGLASLEYLVPNTYGTQFNIASVSKQFTAMGIVKLHLEGKLSIDDDIRDYLPELPDFGRKITLRHMLHHTSGLRSLHLLLALAGWRDDDMRNNDDLLRFMTKQQDLNFEPGSEYMYSNTGYILPAIVIERITGESFAGWTKREILVPLGLYDTYVEDKYNRVVKNYATSYEGSAETGFDREVEYWAYTGAGNIHSTAADLLKWMRYYYKAPAGWEDAFEMMLTLDPFNNGKPNKYAFGVNVNEYKGERIISHSGSIGGYRSFACTYPGHETEIVILTNFSSSDITEKVNAVSDILLDKPHEGDTYTYLKPADIDLRVTGKFTGTYDIDDQDAVFFDIIKDNDSLYCRYNGGSKTALCTANDSVLFNNNARLKISLCNTSPETIIIYTGSTSRRGTKIEKTEPSLKYLEDIAGIYWSPELETQYLFCVRNGKLHGYHARHGEFGVECIKKDLLISDSGFINKITILRKGNKVTGMEVSNSRVKNLRLKKIQNPGI